MQCSAVQCSARNNLRKESRIGTVDNCGQSHRLVAIRIVIARVRVMLVFTRRVQQRLVGDAGLHPSAGKGLSFDCPQEPIDSNVCVLTGPGGQVPQSVLTGPTVASQSIARVRKETL